MFPFVAPPLRLLDRHWNADDDTDVRFFYSVGLCPTIDSVLESGGLLWRGSGFRLASGFWRLGLRLEQALGGLSIGLGLRLQVS